MRIFGKCESSDIAQIPRVWIPECHMSQPVIYPDMANRTVCQVEAGSCQNPSTNAGVERVENAHSLHDLFEDGEGCYVILRCCPLTLYMNAYSMC